MNSVEAAASLFGPEDSSSDPFASLGADAAAEANDVAPSNGHGVPSTSFIQDQYAPPAGPSNDVHATLSNENNGQHRTLVQAAPSQNFSDYASYPNSNSTEQTPYNVGEHWPSNAQQVYPADDMQAYQANSSYWDTYSLGLETTKNSTSHTAYDSYVPQTTVDSHMNAYVPQAVNNESTYSAYNTSAPVAETKVGAPHYNPPYMPSTHSMYGTSAGSTYNANISPPSLATVPVPPAPVPATAVTRPQVSNAYDPPFPPPTKSKRVTLRSGSSQTFSATYSSYQDGNTYNSQPITHMPHQLPSTTPSVAASNPDLRGISHQTSDGYPNDASYLHTGIPSSQQDSLNLTHGPINGYSPEAIGYMGYESSWDAQATNPNVYSDSEMNMNMQWRGSASESLHLSPYQNGQEHSTNVMSQGTEENITQYPDTIPSKPLEPELGGIGINTSELGTAPQFSHALSESHTATNFGDTPRMPSPERLASYSPLAYPGRHIITSPKPAEDGFIANNDNQITGLIHGSGSQHPEALQPGTSLSASQSKMPEQHGPPKGKQLVDDLSERRATSPQSIRSMNGRQSTKPHQSSGRPPSGIDALRGRSMSNGTVLPSSSSYHEDAYAPYQYRKPQPLGLESGNISQAGSYNGVPAYPTYDHPSGAIHDVLVKPQAPYAPSPSLLGSNDPLGRTSSRAPVMSFGFGGKFVTCFHEVASLNTGFDVALASRKATDIHVRKVSKIIPVSALESVTASFPGPLFSDPAMSTSSLVRPGGSSQMKSKKSAVIKYITERAEEISRGLGYLNPGSIERRQAEGKLVLVRLLRVMVENDGRLSGSPSIDTAVRIALVPRLDGCLISPASEFTTIADAHTILPESGSFGLAHNPSDPDPVIAVNTLRSTSLDKIQEFLIRGERRQAYHYALDEKLWAHAMVIASSIDKEAWKEVANEFLKTELRAKDDSTQNLPCFTGKNSSNTQLNGREGLRVAYSLFSGQSSAAIQEMVPQNILGNRGAIKLQMSNLTQTHTTPRTPGFSPPAPLANVPPEALVKWAEIVAMMISGTITPDTSSALTTLGDQLIASHYIEAAHVCYLLAPQTSLMGGLGNPSVRVVLVGSKSPATLPNFASDLDPIIFSEIVEFALSLAPVGKGQENFSGLPHLQAYRFIKAVGLAEMGEIQVANRYCEAISASLSRASPYFTSPLLEQLRGLIDRIGGTSHVDKLSSWMGSKIGKPSLDSIGGWLEGRFTKLVTGDAESPTVAQEVINNEERTFSGPLSTISSATPSARSSPQPTPVNASLPPPPRSGSAVAFSSQSSYAPIDRASSALDYSKYKTYTTPRVASAGATTASFPYTQPLRQPPSDMGSERAPGADIELFTPKLTSDENGQRQEATWWDSSNGYNDNSSAKTPTATTFMRVDESTVRSTSDGFISLMDAPTFSDIMPHPPRNEPPHSSPLQEEDMEDLGFGNTRKASNMNGKDNSEVVQPTEPAKPTEPEKTEPKPAASSSSWLSRWWKRDPTAPGPKKASLGEESSFYYDQDLKRWVNKKSGSDSVNKPMPPAPPSRAQTASPGMTGPRLGAANPANSQTHSTSAIDLSTSPPSKSTMRVRSSLVPPTVDSAPSTPTGTRLVPSGPPPGRPKSQASAKRNIRSRYVDVFQQDGGGP
ncbi:hypothetical protein AX17_003471 [Amanita inopinata Kibby_2008]|nr:hypothetical protein AX17_003471 [Amanita inopinata Kibby_2008]